MKRFMKPTRLVGLFLILFATGCFRANSSKRTPYTSANFLAVTTTQDLRALLRYTPERIPLVSAHRGGPSAGYPENCIATFEHTIQQANTLIEFDVQLSKDDSLVVMHDSRLDRTSTGTGRVQDHTFAELRQMKLKDNDGWVTSHQIPTLSEVLRWARGKTVLTVDVKRDLPAHRIVSAIRQQRAQAYATVITYSVGTLQEYYALDSTLSFSTTVDEAADFAKLKESKVPFGQVMAFVGVAEPPPELYQTLHANGIRCILGTMQLEKTANAAIYPPLVRRGADVLATDRPVEAAAAIRKVTP
jgi:glycerophosphoryl diester phosphodiesterase